MEIDQKILLILLSTVANSFVSTYKVKLNSHVTENLQQEINRSTTRLGNIGFMHNSIYKISASSDNDMVMTLGHERYLETGHGLVGSAYAAPWNSSVTQIFHSDLESNGFRLALMISPPYPPINYMPVLGVGQNKWTLESYTEVQKFTGADEQQWTAEAVSGSNNDAVHIKNLATGEVVKWPGRKMDRLIPVSQSKSQQDELTWWILTEI